MTTVATTDQQARMFSLNTGVSELFRDGNRNPEEVLGVLQTIKEHRDFVAVLRGTAEPNLRFDKRQDGWTLLEHAPRKLVSADGLEAISFLRKGEDPIRGYDLIGRARYALDANYGQEDAEFLLDNQDKIPVELRHCLVFTGSVWRRTDGNLAVTYLYWDVEQCHLSWGLLGSGFGSDVRLLRPGK